MTAERIAILDTTLRDGQQTQGVQFSLAEKAKILRALDSLGIDYVEAGWPGANPTDSSFFSAPPEVRSTRLTAFGMTKRTGRSAENDELLAELVNSGAKYFSLVGKTHAYHATDLLGISLSDNIDNIVRSVSYLTELGREVLFDAEHFFDGHAHDPDHALACLEGALAAGARWVVLCDTNGGTLPARIRKVVETVIQSGIPGDRLGIHAHNDTGTAVASTLAAIDGGVRHIQGTVNGLGERCGNADLVTLLPILIQKEPYRSQFEVSVSEENLRGLTRISRLLDDILNRMPDKYAPYVGSSAFAHKAGLHVAAIRKAPAAYEHVEPDSVGNQRVIAVSNQSGRSNLAIRLREAGIEVPGQESRLSELVAEIKEREDQGYSYDAADASFELFARRRLGIMPEFFSIVRYRVSVEQTRLKDGRNAIGSEAVVVLTVGGERKLSVSEGLSEDSDSGPVHALAKAIAKDLGPYQSYIDDIRLVDFKVRITEGGTEAITRVIIDCEDRFGHRWSTVGVSSNIIGASFEALLDSINWKLVRDGAPIA